MKTLKEVSQSNPSTYKVIDSKVQRGELKSWSDQIEIIVCGKSRFCTRRAAYKHGLAEAANGGTRRITQQQLAARIYAHLRGKWNKEHTEDSVINVRFENGQRYEQTEIGGEFHPSWQTKRFDAGTTLFAYTMHKIKTSDEYAGRYLLPNEYVIINGLRVSK